VAEQQKRALRVRSWKGRQKLPAERIPGT